MRDRLRAIAELLDLSLIAKGIALYACVVVTTIAIAAAAGAAVRVFIATSGLGG